MPSTQIKLDYRNESLNRVVDFWHRKEGLWMCHEAKFVGVSQPISRVGMIIHTW